MKVLFLTCFEEDVGGGVFQSQVVALCRAIALKLGNEDSLELCMLFPRWRIQRCGFFSLKQRSQGHCSEIARRLSACGVTVSFAYLPFVALGRWNFYLNLPLLLLGLAITFPYTLMLVKSARYSVLHCRSYLATLNGLLVKALLPDRRVIFDVRGFFPEEGVIHGCWVEQGFTHRVWRFLERQMFKASSLVICLSGTFEDHVRRVAPSANTAEIPASVDLQVYRPDSDVRQRVREREGWVHKTVFTYSGGLGSWHDPELLFQVFASLSKSDPEAVFLVLGSIDADQSMNRMRKHGGDPARIRVMRSTPQDVVAYLQASDWGIVPLRDLSREGESMRIVAETMVGLKVAEFLAVGLPLLVNESVGGIRAELKKRRLGVTFSPQAIGRIAADIREYRASMWDGQCRKAAEALFSSGIAAEAYCRHYASLDRQ